MNPAEAGQSLAQWAEQLERKAQTFQQLRERMAGLSATDTSADGAVRVTVDAQGIPTELSVTERAGGMDHARISAELMACLRRAQAALSDQARDLVHDVVPKGQDSTAESIVTAYRARFPEQEPSPDPGQRNEIQFDIEDEGNAAPPSRPARRRDLRDEGDDGWADQSLMR